MFHHCRNAEFSQAGIDDPVFSLTVGSSRRILERSIFWVSGSFDNRDAGDLVRRLVQDAFGIRDDARIAALDLAIVVVVNVFLLVNFGFGDWQIFDRSMIAAGCFCPLASTIQMLLIAVVAVSDRVCILVQVFSVAAAVNDFTVVDVAVVAVVVNGFNNGNDGLRIGLLDFVLLQFLLITTIHDHDLLQKLGLLISESICSGQSANGRVLSLDDFEMESILVRILRKELIRLRLGLVVEQPELISKSLDHILMRKTNFVRLKIDFSKKYSVF